MRWFLLVLSGAFTGLGLLTIFRSPDWLSWSLSILAVQFGYLLALVPLVICLGCFYRPGSPPGLGWAVIAVSLIAFVLLVQPCFQAWQLGRRLPALLTASFGPQDVPGRPFGFASLFRPWPAAAPHTTLTYSGSLQLDYYPALGRSHAPCVIVIHGGGWDSGDRGQIGSFNNGLAARGYAVADISYRLAPAAVWPAQREDVAAAVAFVKAQAPVWGIDASRIVLFGRSAGGQIAEAAGYELHDPAIRGVVALYAPSDLIFAWKLGRPDDALNSPELLRRFLGGTPETAAAAFESASALFHVDRRSPPTLMVHGTIDTLVWQRHSIRLAEKLTAAGVPNLLVALPWATHALELNPSGPSGQLADYSIWWFLASVCH